MTDTTPCVRIAIDLDGVLTEHPRPLAAAASERFELQLPESAFVDSAGLNVPIAVREWVYSAAGPAANLAPSPGSQQFLDGVITLLGGENVHIVTARPRESAVMTRDWLSRNGYLPCDILFTDDKTSVARMHGCGYAVEDSERHARNYAAGGVTCFLLQPGEPSPLADEPRIVRVPDLSSVLEALTNLIPAGLIPSSPNGLTRGEPEFRHFRIVISDAIHPAARAELERHSELRDADGTDPAALKASLVGTEALVIRSETHVSAELLAAAPTLRVIARAGVGVDNIDIDAATRAGVVVLNAPGANAISAGEHTIALLLAITRGIPQASAATHAGRWDRKNIKPIDLRGRTVGLVGLGRVGSVVATRLRAFEMRVVAHDPYIASGRFAELGVEQVDYQTLLTMSDVVSFHVPATPETLHMLNMETIALLKPHAIVINAARGEVVDQSALAAAVRSGQVAGAGVDVFPHEPCTSSPLFGLPNVVLTPHTGGSSAEALEAVGRVISTSTIAALRGEVVPNAVNLPMSSLLAPELQRLTSVAGAAGHLLAVLQPELPNQLYLTMRGLLPSDIAEHVLNAALSEALPRWTARRVTPVNARLVAAEAGLSVKIVTVDQEPGIAPRFAFEVTGEANHHVTISWDRTSAGIVEVDRFSLERALAGDVLITHHRDQPGIIGQLGTILGRHHVNIAGMQVGRHQRGGEAIMVLNVDDIIPAEALAEIVASPGVGTAYVVSLPPAVPELAPQPMLTV